MTHLFINGAQAGDNATFADWHADDAEAVEDARAFFCGKGYRVESVTVAHVESPLASTARRRILTVRITTRP